MSFQSYLDNIEKKTGKTPAEIINAAHDAGLNNESKTNDIVIWLKENYELGHGHAMSLAHVMRHGTKLDNKHVGSNGVHRDELDELRLDGIANR